MLVVIVAVVILQHIFLIFSYKNKLIFIGHLNYEYGLRYLNKKREAATTASNKGVE